MTEKKYKIIYDREGCTGAGACVAACPENWEMGADNKANCKNTEIDEAALEKNMEAARVCPVNVIQIEEKETGKKLV